MVLSIHNILTPKQLENMDEKYLDILKDPEEGRKRALYQNIGAIEEDQVDRSMQGKKGKKDYLTK